MGLFSSKEETPRTPSTLNKPFSYSGTQYGGRHYLQNENTEQMLRTYRQEELQRQKQQEDLIYQFQRLSVSRESEENDTSGFQPLLVKVNSILINELLYKDENYISLNSNDIYNLTPLKEDSVEFLEIKNLFRRSNKNQFFKVNSIEKIYNSYLLAQYKLMEKCYRNRYGRTNTKKLFHGTRK